MARARTTRVVGVPVDDVWSVLADFAEVSRWGGGVDQSSLLSTGPVGVGTTRRVQVGRLALRETVVVWEAGRSLSYTIAGLPAIVTDARNTWELEPVGRGTRITLTADVTTRGGPLPARVVARAIGRTNAGLVAGLAAHVRTGVTR